MTTAKQIMSTDFPRLKRIEEHMPREWIFPKYDHLQDAVKRFFEILDIVNESSHGREFHPNKMDLDTAKINSCRVHNSAELESVLKQMKVLSGYEQQKQMKDWNI